MEKSEHLAIWFSGFFGLGAVVHLLRLLLQLPVRIGSFDVPLRVSALLVLLLGGLSIGLLRAGGKWSCCGK